MGIEHVTDDNRKGFGLMVEQMELLPDAARTIEGLRDTGYDYLTAVADIVEGPIAADATRVVIRLSNTN